jgi:protein-S-isoprenylcysteine O-methyltransferase Ste14
MLWLRTLVFAVLVPGTVLGLVPAWIVRSGLGGRIELGAARWAGLLPLISGAALMLWCWSDFVTRGRGTPAPIDPPRRLVVAGPYRVVRNPMYVAGVLILVGAALLWETPSLLAYAAVFWLTVHLFVVGYEEPTLARRFGDEYEDYRRRVRRWRPELKRGEW